LQRKGFGNSSPTMFGYATRTLLDQVVATADPLPLIPCDPFTSTPTTPLQLPEIIPFAKPDSIKLTLQPPKNCYTHPQFFLSFHMFLPSLIPPPLNNAKLLHPPPWPSTPAPPLILLVSLLPVNFQGFSCFPALILSLYLLLLLVSLLPVNFQGFS
jgi:hypothetical protein